MTADAALRSASASGSDQNPDSAPESLDPEAEFALTFDAEAVHLMEREAGDWSWRGAARLDAADLGGRMAALRRLLPHQAQDRVALIIPDDQILYTELSVDPSLPRADAVLQAIDGLTPYAVGDLAIDWRDEAPDRVKVAAVWRQTLAEAEAFATRNGFVPAGLIADTEGHELPGGACFAAHEAAAAGRAAGSAQIDGSPREGNEAADLPARRTDAAQGDDASTADAGQSGGSSAALAEMEAEAMRRNPPVRRGPAARRDRGKSPPSEATEDRPSEAPRGTDEQGARIEAVDQPGATTEPPAGGSWGEKDGEHLADMRDADDDLDGAESTTPTSIELAASIAKIRALSRRAALAAAATAAPEVAETARVIPSPMVEALRATARDRLAVQRRLTEQRASAAAASTPAPTPSASDPEPRADAPPATVADDAAAFEAGATPISAAEGDAAGGIVPTAIGGDAGSATDSAGEVPRLTAPPDERRNAAPLGAAALGKTPPLPGALGPEIGPMAPPAGAAGMRVRDAAQRAGRHPQARGGLGIMLALLAAGLLVVFFFGGGAGDPPMTAAESDTAIPDVPAVAPRALPHAIASEVAPASEAQAAATVPSAAGTTAVEAPAPDLAASPAPSPVAAVPATEPAATGSASGPAVPTAGPRGVGSAIAPAPAVPQAAAPSPATASQPLARVPDALPAEPVTAPRSAIESAIAEAVAEASAVEAPGLAAPARQPRGPQALAVPEPRVAPTLAATPADPAPVLPAGTAGAPAAAAAEAPLTARRPAARPVREVPAAVNSPPAAAASPADSPAAAPRSPAPSPRPATLTTTTAPATPETGTGSTAPRPAAPAPPGAAPVRDTATAPAAIPAADGAAPSAKPAQAAPVSSSRPLPRPRLERQDAGLVPPAPAPARQATAAAPPSLRLALAGDAGQVAGAELRLLAMMPQAVARGALRVHGPSEAALLHLTAAAPLLRVAQSRPPRREFATAAVAPIRADAVEAALNEASASPAASSQTARLSGRPQPKPGSARFAAPSASLLSAEAVEGAIAAAIEASPAPPGGIALSALRSSPLPPRAPPRGSNDVPDAAAEAAAAAVAAISSMPATAPPAVDSAALEAQSAAAAERRRLDDELQRQVEARIRARASADARIEAEQRASAEARARAQAAAEERAAAASRQPVRAAEVDDEPELIAAASGGSTTASVASNATISRGMDLRRTTLIGVIGAGPASRGLIRLRNGRIVTVRLGDKIDGGTITSIGNSRVTYVKSGRPFELKMLDSR